jgi:hypothetical protein
MEDRELTSVPAIVGKGSHFIFRKLEALALNIISKSGTVGHDYLGLLNARS